MRNLKLLLAIALFTISNLSLATPTQTSPFNGILIGAGINSATQLNNFSMTGWATGITFFSNKSSVNTIGGSLALAYQRTLNQWLLGAGITTRLISGHTSGTRVDNINTPQMSIQHLTGLEFTAGHLISPSTALYAIFGPELTAFRVHQRYDNSNFSFTEHQLGAGAGLGLATALNQHLLLQLSYLYIYYHRFRHPDAVNTSTITITPKMHIVTLALAYRFPC